MGIYWKKLAWIWVGAMLAWGWRHVRLDAKLSLRGDSLGRADREVQRGASKRNQMAPDPVKSLAR